VAAGARGCGSTDRAQESGLDFVHFNGMTGRFGFPKSSTLGVGLFDYDAMVISMFPGAGTDAR
jgi:hypothetical protein